MPTALPMGTTIRGLSAAPITVSSAAKAGAPPCPSSPSSTPAASAPRSRARLPGPVFSLSFN